MAMISFYQKQNQLSRDLKLSIEQREILRKFFDENFEQLNVLYSISNTELARMKNDLKLELNDYFMKRSSYQLGDAVSPFLKVELGEDHYSQVTTLSLVVYKGGRD